MQVPTLDAPNVAPSGPAGGLSNYQQVQVTPEAAGVNIAQAAAGLADTVEKHALAFQGLQNEAAARDANNAFGADVSKAWEDYRSLQGKNAVDSYPAFQSQIAGLRAKYLGQMGNPETYKMFDQAAAPYMRYMLDGGARYAGDQNRAWIAASHKATEIQAVNNAVLNRNDPRMIEAQLASGIDSVEQQGKQAGLDDGAISALKEAYRSDGYRKVISAIAIDSPKSAQAYLNNLKDQRADDGAPLIGGEQLDAAQKTIDQSVRAAQAQAEHNVVMADKAQRDNDRKVTTQLFDGIQAGTITKDNIMASDLPAFGQNSKEQLIAALTRETKPDPISQVSHETSSALFEQIHLPDGDPKKITSIDQLYPAFIDGKMNRTDFDWVRKEFSEAQQPDGSQLGQKMRGFLDAVKPTIMKSTALGALVNPESSMQFYYLQQAVADKVSRARAAGKDPYDLFNPAKPDFLGKPEALAPYQMSLPDAIKAYSDRLRGSATAPTQEPVKITGDDDYNKLPSGATFLDPTGKKRVKP